MYVESLLTKDGILLGTSISERLKNLEKDVQDLISITQGKGGFLDPHDFGTAEPTEEELYRYYKQQITIQYIKKYPDATPEEIGLFILNNPIPEQTKIKNLYDGAVWVYANERWYNDGTEVVIAANNEGVFGTVTGSKDKYKISIDTNSNGQSLGTMTVNGLEEEFGKVVYTQQNNSSDNLYQAYVQTPTQEQELLTISKNADDSTLVQRTSNGFVECNTPEQTEENKKIAINIEWLDSWFELNSVTDEEIEALINETFSKEEVNE